MQMQKTSTLTCFVLHSVMCVFILLPSPFHFFSCANCVQVNKQFFVLLWWPDSQRNNYHKEQTVIYFSQP